MCVLLSDFLVALKSIAWQIPVEMLLSVELPWRQIGSLNSDRKPP